jgi:hypothetical protein
MSLGRASSDSGVTGASGTMAYQWGETCDGWPVEQRYRLKMGYAESSDVNIASNFVTWEAKDGLTYRFNQKETRNGADQDEIKGVAKLEGVDKGGTVEFEQPAGKSFELPPGALFPSTHTIMLIDKAKAGEFPVEAGLRWRNRRERGAGVGGNRTQGRARSRCCQEEPFVEPAGLARAVGVFSGRPESRKA